MSSNKNPGYKYKLVRVQKNRLESPQKGLFVYHFRTRFNYRYVVIVELYEHNIYGIKYYYIGHRMSKKKYNLKTGNGDCFRILSTCLNIMHDIYIANKKISFAFIGAHSSIKRGIQEDMKNTQRFRIYKGKVFNVFDIKRFSFYQDIEKSLFLVKNKRLKVTVMQINDLVNSVHEGIELIEC